MFILANQATAAKRRVYFHCVDATDGITPETAEAGGQPQVSTDGAAWTNTGIGVLVAVGNGRYYAELTQTLVATAGVKIETRYKSANTAETPGDSVRVVAFDIDDAADFGLTNLDAAISTRSSHSAADVWASGTRTLTSFGTLVADIWANATRSLTTLAGLVPANFTALSITAGGLVDIVQGAADKVWSTAVRVLTAGTNIALAKGTGVTGFTDIDAAGVRTAVGLASNDLDTQLAALPTAVENADALLDRAAAIDGATPRQALQRVGATTAGVSADNGSGQKTYYGFDGTTARVVSTPTAGVRPTVTYP